MQIGNDMVCFVAKEKTLNDLWAEFFGRRTLAQSAVSVLIAIGLVALFSFNGLVA